MTCPGPFLPLVSIVAIAGIPGYRNRVQVTETVSCPYCGQSFELVIDTSIRSQRFTTDCEVCCRPFEVIAECEPGEILSLDVQAG